MLVIRPASVRYDPSGLKIAAVGRAKLARFSRLNTSKRSCTLRESPNLSERYSIMSTVALPGPITELRGAFPMAPAG